MSTAHHWYILGAGAIGTLWSAYWSLDKKPATAIVRSESTLKKLTLEHDKQTFPFSQQQLNYNKLKQPIDHLLITTKAHQTQQALANIASQLSEHATIIILQNGLAIKNISVSPKQTLIAATTTDGAHFKDSNKLYHVGNGISYLGLWNQNEKPFSNQQKEELLTSLPQQLNISFCDNIEERLWQKLAINCAINALGVKHQCTNGELLRNPIIHNEFKALCEEIASITRKLNLGPWFDEILAHASEVAKLTSANINSTLQDINAGKQSEISELNGRLLQSANEINYPAPINKALVDLILEKEQGYS